MRLLVRRYNRYRLLISLCDEGEGEGFAGVVDEGVPFVAEVILFDSALPAEVVKHGGV